MKEHPAKQDDWLNIFLFVNKYVDKKILVYIPIFTDILVFSEIN